MARPAGVDRHGRREARRQHASRLGPGQDADAHWHALDDLGEVAGGVLRRQQGELRPGAWGEAVHDASHVRARQSVDGPLAEPPLTAAALQAQAEAAERERRYELALRLRFRAGLTALAERERLSGPASRVNGELSRELACRRENDVLFINAICTDRSGIDSAVAGVDDDGRDVPHRRRCPGGRLRRDRIESPSGDGAKYDRAQHPAPPAAEA